MSEFGQSILSFRCAVNKIPVPLVLSRRSGIRVFLLRSFTQFCEQVFARLVPILFTSNAITPVLIRHVCCCLNGVGVAFLRRTKAAAGCRKFKPRETGDLIAMAKDDRDILEILQEELDFIEKGGYGRSVRTPWLPKSIFQDSLSCLNYGYPYRAHPCNECHLIEFVSAEHQSETIPCHFIPLNEAGETIEDMEANDSQSKLEEAVKGWLRAKISVLERQRVSQTTGL
jgi:hypothetical protein